MSPLRLLGALVASSRHRICARSASLLRHRLLHGRRPATASALSAAALVGVGGMSFYNYRNKDQDDEDDDDDSEESVIVAARKPIHHHQELLEDDETYEEKAMKKRFEEWIIKYGRTYRDKQEKAMRYEIFKSTAQRVDELNSRPGALCTFGTTVFADKTVEEFPRGTPLGPAERVQNLDPA